MIKETAAKAAGLANGGKVGILATDGTIKTGLYQTALETEGAVPCVLDAEGQSYVMHEIYDCVKAGKPADMDMWKKIDDQLKELGCQVALLACTELSVIKADNNLPDFYLGPDGSHGRQSPGVYEGKDQIKKLPLRSIISERQFFIIFKRTAYAFHPVSVQDLYLLLYHKWFP